MKIQIVALMLLAGCATTPAVPTGMTGTELADAKAAIVMNLRDPESAVFGEARAYAISNGETAACIMVNARNGFGGMTGFTPALVNTAPGRAPIVFLDEPAAYECSALANGMSNRF